MNTQWRGVESDRKAEERVRVCSTHHRILAIDERRDRMVCPMGHDVASFDGSFAVMTRSKAEAMEASQRGGVMRGVKGSGPKDRKGLVRAIEGTTFQDGAGWRLRLTLRASKDRFEVFVLHLSPDKKQKRSGVLDAFDTEALARSRYQDELGKARRKGWLPALNRRGGGGLKEIPEPQAPRSSGQRVSRT